MSGLPFGSFWSRRWLQEVGGRPKLFLRGIDDDARLSGAMLQLKHGERHSDVLVANAEKPAHIDECRRHLSVWTNQNVPHRPEVLASAIVDLSTNVVVERATD